MIDIVACACAAVIVAALLLTALRVLRGAPLFGRGRTAIACATALVATAVAAWKVSGAPSIQLVGTPVLRVDTGEPVIALTFDDGPSAEHGGAVLDLLRAEGVHATFFVVGESLASNREIGRRMVAEGHELADHSFTHRRMIGRSLDFLRSEIERTDAEIRRAGQRGEILFRPPYGKRLVALPWLLEQLDRKMVLWDVAPDSADPTVSAQHIVDDVVARARPGSIVLLHLMARGRETSRAALPGVVRALRQRGYRFVTVSQLLARRGQPARAASLSLAR